MRNFFQIWKRCNLDNHTCGGVDDLSISGLVCGLQLVQGGGVDSIQRADETAQEEHGQAHGRAYGAILSGEFPQQQESDSQLLLECTT